MSGWVAKNRMVDRLTLSPGCHILIGVKHLPVCSDVVQTGRRDHILGMAKSSFCVVDSRPDPGKVVAGVGPSGQEFRGCFRGLVSDFTSSPCRLVPTRYPSKADQRPRFWRTWDIGW